MSSTVRLKNTNPLGAVDVPLLRRSLEAGEEFDCPSEHAEALLEQSGNYERVQSVTKKTEKKD